MSTPLSARMYVVSPLAGETYEVRSGNVYTADSTGLIGAVTAISAGDLIDLMNSGCFTVHVSWIGKLNAANFNVSTDQAITLDLPPGTNFRVTKITVKNASTSLTTAAGGVYTAASKGGDAVVANTQAYSGLTAANLALDLTIATTPGKTVYNQASVPSLFLSLTTPQGGAATGDVYVYGDVYW